MSRGNTDSVTVTKDGKKYTGKPYVDFKTFQGWKAEGRTVKKGQKTIYQSVSFPKGTDKKSGETKSFPRTYSLFHYSQTQ